MFAVSNVFRVANKVRNFAERTILSEHKLTFSGFTVLWVLWINGKMESQALANESGVSKSTLTGIVKTLEKQSIVVREPDTKDRRRVFVSATPKGKKTMSQIFPEFNLLEAAVTKDLTAQEKNSLARMLRIVLHSLDQHGE